MVVVVMGPAQRHGELVADLEPQRMGLGEPQVVGVSGASPADQTRLGCNELQVRFVAMAARRADGQLAFLDFCRTRLADLIGPVLASLRNHAGKGVQRTNAGGRARRRLKEAAN